MNEYNLVCNSRKIQVKASSRQISIFDKVFLDLEMSVVLVLTCTA